MKHEDPDTPNEPNLPSNPPTPPNPQELHELTDIIQLTLLEIAEHPGAAETKKSLMVSPTSRDETREMWLMQDLRLGTQLWLDACGNIWQTAHDDPDSLEVYDLSQLDIGTVWYYKALVLSFLAHISS